MLSNTVMKWAFSLERTVLQRDSWGTHEKFWTEYEKLKLGLWCQVGILLVTHIPGGGKVVEREVWF